MVTLPLAAASSATVVAVDVGGTTVKASRVRVDGSREAELSLPTGTGDAAVLAVIQACRSMMAASTVALTLAVAGNIDVDAGVVRLSANIGWRSLALRQIVTDAVGGTVTLIHDASAACTAETAVGVARGCADVLVVVIGTGLAAGIVVAGHGLAGASGSAGELGHLVVAPGGRPCACGQRGCLEAYASASAIARRHVELGGEATLTAAEISSSDTPAAVRAWMEASDALGQGVHAVTALLDPAVVVLAGGLAQAGERLATPVRQSLERQLPWRAPPTVRISSLGAQGGQIGAAICAWHSVGQHEILEHWQTEHWQTESRETGR